MGGAGHYALGVFTKAAPEPVAEPVKVEPKGPDLEAIINQDAESQAPGSKLVGKYFSAQNGKMDWLHDALEGQVLLAHRRRWRRHRRLLHLPLGR